MGCFVSKKKMLLVILQGRVVKGDQGFNRPQSAVIPPPPLSPVGLFFGFLSFQWGLTPGTSVWGVPAYGLLSLGHARLCVSDLHADCVHHPAAPPRNMCVERQNKQALTQPDLMMHSTVNEPVFQLLTTNQAKMWVCQKWDKGTSWFLIQTDTNMMQNYQNIILSYCGSRL